MENLKFNYKSYAKALPPRPIRITMGSWAGLPVKMEDGSEGQPWHCLPFVEGSTYGLELIYPYETECHVVNDNGAVRFDWDYTKEPGGMVTGGEFVLFSPLHAAKYYLYNTRLDLKPPPGYVIRTEPHPRYFTDDTGTVPLSMIGNLQHEWYPRMMFVVFRAPWPGQRHIFRKGEAIAQFLFVPQRAAYEPTEMSVEEASQRRELEQAINMAKLEIADNKWRVSVDGAVMNNHYKILARAFARGGMAAVEETVREGIRKHREANPIGNTIEEALARAQKLVTEHQYALALEIYEEVLRQDPDNAEALCHLGICYVCRGNSMDGLWLMTRAVALAPHVPRYQSSLGELYRRLGKLPEAEACLRVALALTPGDPELTSVLGLILAQQGRVEEGLEAYRAASGLGCRLPITHFQMGLVLAQHGRRAEARDCYQAALTFQPNFEQAQRALQELLA